MGGGKRKQYLELRGKRILEHSLERFEVLPWVTGIVVVVPAEDVEECRVLCKRFSRVHACVAGGKSRFQSVRNGVTALSATAEDIILVHDAVRPLVSAALCERVRDKTLEVDAAIAALPLKGTIKQSDSRGLIDKTVDRRLLWEAQTPQGFVYEHLQAAYHLSASWDDAQCDAITDEAMLMESIGVPVVLVEGEETNLKITRPLDLRLAEAIGANEAKFLVRQRIK